MIENRPGAATVLGVEAASRAAPDGNTPLRRRRQLLHHPSELPRSSAYDPLTSFEPICLLANSPQVIVVNSSSPYKTLTEWLDAVRAKPGELSHASVGPASPQHIAFEQLKLMAKVNITFVPFNGNTQPALNALLGGHVGSVDVQLELFGGLQTNRARAKLRARSRVAKTQKREFRGWPNVPTVAEQGFKDYAVEALVRPRGAGQDAEDKVAELSKWCAEAMTRTPRQSGTCRVSPQSAGHIGRVWAHLRKQSDDYARDPRKTRVSNY